MRIPRRIALAAMGLIAIAASASAPPATDTAAAEEAALRAADRTFMRAYRKGDLETVVELYTEDAVLLPARQRRTVAAAPAADVQRCTANLEQYDTADRGPVRVGRSALLHAADGAGGL